MVFTFALKASLCLVLTYILREQARCTLCCTVSIKLKISFYEFTFDITLWCNPQNCPTPQSVLSPLASLCARVIQLKAEFKMAILKVIWVTRRAEEGGSIINAINYGYTHTHTPKYGLAIIAFQAAISKPWAPLQIRVSNRSEFACLSEQPMDGHKALKVEYLQFWKFKKFN